MGKKFSKILTIVLAVSMIATVFFVVPMTASVEASADETYEDYDVIGYKDLRKSGNPLAENGLVLPKNDNVYDYASTSSSHSAIIKFRATVQNTSGRFEMHFSSWGNTNNFAYKLDGGNWKWQHGGVFVSAQKIEQGNTYDVEMARLKVKTGNNAGKYYTYLKVNGFLLIEQYVEADVSDTTNYLGDRMYFYQGTSEAWKISEYAEPDFGIYEPYEVIEYKDLKESNSYLASGGITLSGTDNQYDYLAYSPTHSAIIKYRVTAGDTNKFQMHFGGWNDSNNFAYYLESSKWKWQHDSSHNASVDGAAVGDTYDVEMARLKIKTGENAGKYHTYLKVNGSLLLQEYVSADDPGTTAKLNNDKLYFHQESASSGWVLSEYQEPEEETYEPYDEIDYFGLYRNGNALGVEDNPKNATYTYESESPSHSVIVKFRWKAITGTKAWFSFDTRDNNIGYTFGMQFSTPESGHENGQVDLLIDGRNKIDLPFPLVTGNDYDVEFARLKVKNGVNKGKYYVYLKINGTFIGSYYTNKSLIDSNGNYTEQGTTCSLSNKFYADYWGADGNKITATPAVEEYYDYVELAYTNLYKNGNILGGEDNPKNATYTYNDATPTYSAIVYFRWKAVTGTKAWFSFDTCNNSIGHTFGMQFSTPESGHENGQVDLLIDGRNKIDLPFPLVTGNNYDVEFARLKVKNGANKGKYYVYLKINGTFIGSYYTDKDLVDSNGNYTEQGTICTLSNKFYADYWGADGNRITSSPIEQTYYDYDVIQYEDLKDESGNSLGDEIGFNGAKTFTYNRTSPTGSAILKYRWTVGTVPKFQLSFDNAYENNGTTKSIDYMFGVAISAPDGSYPIGSVNLRPGYESKKALPEALEEGCVYDVEFARLKVSSGPNKNKYYVYIKIDGEIISESYTDVNVVDSNNHYISKPGAGDGNTTDVAISNKIFMTFYSSYCNKLSQSWENGKGYYVSYYANGQLVEKVPFTVDEPTVEGREPQVPVIPNATGVWEPHPVSGLTKGISVDAVYTVNVPQTDSQITLNRYNGSEINISSDIIREYMALPMSEQTAYVRNYCSNKRPYQDYQSTTFSWSDIGSNNSYTVYFADNTSFRNAFIVNATGNQLVNKVGIFVPGKTYYWFVAGNDNNAVSAVDTFTVADSTVRYITAGKVTNMRDEGGYITKDGKTVNYGLVYRGASLDEDHSYVDDMARYVFDYLGMKSEIELRGGIIHNQTGWDDNNKNVYYINANCYTPILTLDNDQKAQYKATFEAMADRRNYPFYFHCSAGADRTGTFGYLLNGLLGVSLKQLRADYELTSFSEVGVRGADSQGSDSFDAMHSLMMEQYGDGSGDISVAIENFLTQYIGLSGETLDSIKEIMLEKDPYDLDDSGIADAQDVMILTQAILTNSNNVKFDVNTDGRVDIIDLVKMKKYLAGIYVRK